jgi:hypothetical protein
MVDYVVAEAVESRISERESRGSARPTCARALRPTPSSHPCSADHPTPTHHCLLTASWVAATSQPHLALLGNHWADAGRALPAPPTSAEARTQGVGAASRRIWRTRSESPPACTGRQSAAKAKARPAPRSSSGAADTDPPAHLTTRTTPRPRPSPS